MNKFLTTTTLVMGVVILLAINIISNVVFQSSRVDLTASQLYTLSQGSKNILSTLEEPLTLRLYFSQRLAKDFPAINTYAIRVRELLQEYQRLAGNKIKFTVIDPEPFSEEEDRAVGYGLQGVPVDSSNTMFYFGLVGNNTVGDEQVIPFFQSEQERTLEYDLTKLVYTLANPQQKVIGVLSSLPIMGRTANPMNPMAQPSPAWAIIEQLKQIFEIRQLDMNADSIPEDVNVLMLVHPKDFKDSTLYAVDQFVMRGGRVIAFVDPFAESDRPDMPQMAMNHKRTSSLGKLSNSWGIEITDGKVVADMDAAKQVQLEQQGRAAIADYPVWIDMNSKNFRPDDVITNRLDTMTFASVGAITKKDGVAIDFVPLVESSTQSELIDASKLAMLEDPQEITKDFKASGQRYVIAARISGALKTAFPDGKPKKETTPEEDAKKLAEPEKKEEAPKPQIMETKESANLIVIADSDMLFDQFWIRTQRFLGQKVATPIAANGTFISNAIENLMGSNDLISVRNRGSFNHPFTKIADIQKEAEKRFREKEQQLITRLKETEEKINQLQSQRKDAANTNLTAEQQKTLESFRDEQVSIRKELRAVQHELRKDIESLEFWLKVFNIGFLALLVGIAGIMFNIQRQRQKKSVAVA